MILITVEIDMKNVILSFKIISIRSLLRNLRYNISKRYKILYKNFSKYFFQFYSSFIKYFNNFETFKVAISSHILNEFYLRTFLQ